MHPSHFVLLFPTGHMGWEHSIPHVVLQGQQPAGPDEPDQHSGPDWNAPGAHNTTTLNPGRGSVVSVQHGR